jgi:tRNA threonylcarbamoyladenosine biosynthesis protein TsaE
MNEAYKNSVYKNVTEAELRRLAAHISAGLAPGSIIALTGDLGAGKTVFAKAVGEALGVTETINSPTFTIIKEYESGRLPFYHFDVYRIETPDETEMAGFEEYFFGRGVSVIEWADNIEGYIPESATRVEIAYGDKPDTRTVTVRDGITNGMTEGADLC